MPEAKSPSQYDVPGAARQVARQATFVRIDRDAIARWVRAVDPARIRPVQYPGELAFVGTPSEVVRWVLLVDCLNFCFWTESPAPWVIEYQDRPWRRYLALRAALLRAVEQDRAWLTPQRWSSATARELEGVFAGRGRDPAHRGRIPMFDHRVRVVNETGRVVLACYGGEPVHLVEQAGYHAAAVAARLADEFESFRDVHRYRDIDVPILKRAQIFAADLAGTWAANGGPRITELESLTAFADYRIPQVLRHLGILVLDAGFEARIEAGRLIPGSSDEEIELRTCSIWAVEEMCRALKARQDVEIPAWTLDEYLWERSHDPEVSVQHHRTPTWYY